MKFAVEFAANFTAFARINFKFTTQAICFNSANLIYLATHQNQNDTGFYFILRYFKYNSHFNIIV
ncbi:hypothetical protein CAMSH0001_1289 [Campylobacter showae RM3277]|uniref:Uncharacterized protein n=1 Tax=Campylobacter showae RM3277 TaxID=553219 RepID=C6RDY1_9BACT|nr:hypothetical protein CAMSH0001_1289 [Campylobacter showae RM3277]